MMYTPSVRRQPRTIETTGQQETNPVDRASSDYNRSKQYQQMDSTQEPWQFHEAMVDVAVPGLGYYVVTVSGGVGRVAAKQANIGGLWGATVSEAIATNSRVLCAIDRDRGEYIVVAQLPDLALNEDLVFPNSSTLFSPTGTVYDPIVDFAKTTADQGWIFATQANIPIDAVLGDWRVCNALGGSILVSSLTISMSVDEITGIWIDTLDQRVEISGRHLSLESDSVRIDNDTYVGKLQLGGEQRYVTDPVINVDEFDITARRQQDSYSIYDIEGGDSLFSFNVYAVASGSIYVTDNLVESSSGLTVRGSQSQVLVGGQLPKFADYRETQDENTAVYPKDERGDRENVVELLDKWANYDFKSIFNRPIQSLASISHDFMQSESSFMHFSTENVDFAGSDGVLNTSESFTPDVPKRDPTFSGKLVPKTVIQTFIHETDDGGIMIGTEGGACIRIVGNTVMLDCATLRVAAVKDCVFMGRDFDVLTSRNVTLQAGKHLRAYAKTNVNIIGGVAGRGGVLIESRGSNRDASLPSSAEDAVFAGVVSRAANSFVAMQGGDVVLDSGVLGDGAVLTRSPRAIMLQTPMLVNAANSVLFLPTDPTAVSNATFIGRTQAVFAGSLKAKTGWFDGSLSARSNIQSMYGRVADSQGGYVQKANSGAQFTAAIRRFDETVNEMTRNWIESRTVIVARTEQPGGILEQQTRRILGGGFIPPGEARDHYGTNDMQTSTMRTFPPGRIGTIPLRSLRVVYREGSGGSPTYGWPGNTDEINLATIPMVESFASRCSAIVKTEPNEPELQLEGFGQAFSTIK